MFLNGNQVRFIPFSMNHRKWTIRKLSTSRILKNVLGECKNLDSSFAGELASQPRIIIVGAGVAGLSAAQRLTQCGLTDITIIDGLNRPGGRVDTQEVDGCKIDLGAQWIYGSTICNPIFNIAAQEGLIKQPLDIRDPYKGFFFTCDGSPIDAYVSNKAKKAFETMKQKAYTHFAKQTEHIHTSLWHYFVKAINEEMKKQNKIEQHFSQKVLLGLTNDLKTRFSADLSDVTLGSLNHYNQIPGGDIAPKSGFSDILKPMLESIPKEALKLSKKVQTIKWYTGAEPRVEVYTSDGSVFGGDYVIVTVSLGVLKRKHSQLLIPTLPANKVLAIEAIGFGHSNKIFLQYSKPFWVPGEFAVRPSWSFDEINDRHWLHSISVIEEAPGCPNILMFEVSGTEAMYLEREKVLDISQKITCLLRKFSADNSIPEPKSLVKTTWSYDPLFLGGKSYVAKDTYPKHFKDLITPLPEIRTNAAPSLFIAGEATSFGNLGTVHGARLSGIREADNIVTLTKRFRGRPPVSEQPDKCNFCLL